MPLGHWFCVQPGGVIELMKVFVAVSTDVMAWFVPSAKYMIRFSGSNEAKSKAPAAVVQPGTGIKPIVLRLAFGVSVCPQTVGVKKHKTHHRRTQRQYDRFHKVLLYSSTYSKRQVCIESFGKLGLHAAALPNFFVLLCLCGSKNLPLMFGLRLSALQAGIHSLYWNIFVMLQVPCYSPGKRILRSRRQEPIGYPNQW